MVTNLDFLTQFTKGDKAKMKKYIEMYLDTAQQKMDVMKNSISTKEYETLKVAAHTMKSQARYMGITSAEADIVSLEHACTEQNNLEQIPLLVEKVNAVLAQSITELSEKVKTL
jgi:HPt (histidine-containing phosphotransfer) domain-containing protein